MTPTDETFSVPREALEECAREPIHLPGRVQPFGVLLAFDSSLNVAQCSANASELIGVPPEQLLGRPPEAALGMDGSRLVRAVVPALRPGYSHDLGSFLLPSGIYPSEAHAHAHDGVTVVELISPGLGFGPEAVGSAPLLMSELYEATHLFHSDETIEEISHRLVGFLRRGTGYDRVMVYRFDPEWNGEVIAEARRDDLPPYLGLWYPASDIPPQARHLYLLNRLRVLGDVSAAAVPLLPRRHPETGRELDLSFALLRDFSPVHREYLTNMGVRSSLSAAVVQEGRLWGLIACHHNTPRVPQRAVRSMVGVGAEILGALSRQLEVRPRQRGAAVAQAILSQLPRVLKGHRDWVVGLVQPQTELLAALRADGLAVVHEGRVAASGVAPPADVLRQIADWLEGQPGPLVATDRLGVAEPRFAPCAAEASGLMAIRLPPGFPGWIMWLRRELPTAVTWGGDPRKGLVSDGGPPRLTPRKSFEAWTQEVRGRSRHWTVAETSLVDEAIRPNLLNVLIDWEERENERLRLEFELVFGQVNDAVILFDLGGLVTHWNAAAAAMFGARSEDVVGRPFRGSSPPGGGRIAAMVAAVRGGGPVGGEWEERREDGTRIWLDVRAQQYLDAGGTPRGVVAIARDITARKIAEEQLQFLSTVIASTNDGVMVTEAEPLETPGPRIVYANPALLALTGYTEAEVLGQSPRMFQGPGTDPAVLGRLRRALGAGELVQVELLNYRKDGTAFWAELHISPLRDAAGRLTHFIAIQRDVSERKRAVEARDRAEQALRESESRFRTVVENLPDGVFVLDPDDIAEPLRILFANPAAAAADGYALQDMTGRSLLNFLHSPGAGLTPDRAARVLGGEMVEFESLHRHRDGHPVPLEVRALTIPWQGRRVILGIERDVSERKRSEAALQESAERLQFALDSGQLGIWEWEIATGRVVWDEAHARLFGIRLADFDGTYQGFARQVHPDDLPGLEHRVKEALAARSVYHFEFRAVWPDGAVRWVGGHGLGRYDDAGNPVRMLGVVQDVTFRREAEETRRNLLQRLISAQEDERARIARDLHDGVGQSLTSLLLGLRVLANATKRREVRSAAKHLRQITAGVLDEVRNLARGLRPSVLDDLGFIAALERYAADFSRAHGVRIELHLEGAGSVRLPSAVETALYRILQEALANVAKHAAARTVSLAFRRLPRAVELSVTDDGCGFDATDRARGLLRADHFGLTSMHERASLLGGEFAVESSPGAGTTVRVVIPLAPELAHEPHPLTDR